MPAHVLPGFRQLLSTSLTPQWPRASGVFARASSCIENMSICYSRTGATGPKLYIEDDRYLTVTFSSHEATSRLCVW